MRFVASILNLYTDRIYDRIRIRDRTWRFTVTTTSFERGTIMSGDSELGVTMDTGSRSNSIR